MERKKKTLQQFTLADLQLPLGHKLLASCDCMVYSKNKVRRLLLLSILANLKKKMFDQS